MAGTREHIDPSGVDRPPGDARPSVRSWGALRVVGIFGLCSSLVVRVVEFGLIGVWLGIDDLVNVLRLLGALGAQVFGLLGTFLVIALSRELLNSRRRGALRALVVASLLVVAVSIAIASGALSELVRFVLGERLLSRLPVESGLVLAATVATLSAAVGVEAVAEPRRRAPGIVLLGASATAFALCGRALVMQFASTESAAARFVSVALAALEWFALGAMSIFAMAWLGSRGGLGGERRRLARWKGPAVVVGSMATACGGTFLAVSGQRPEATSWALFVARCMDIALDPFNPLVPFALRSYAELLRIAFAGLGLILLPREGRMCVSVAFSLLGAGLVDTPAGGLALMLGAVILALDGQADDPGASDGWARSELPSA